MTVKAASVLIHAGQFEWVRKRLSVLVFEECWPFGVRASFEHDEQIILNQLQSLAGTIKNRNAAGLGSLAYAHSTGDRSVLIGGKEDIDIKIISAAIARPDIFWSQIRREALNRPSSSLIENAFLGFGMSEFPWDKVFMMAAAYLAAGAAIPETSFSETDSKKDFPFWVCIDMHTSEGTGAIKKSAMEISFDPEKALWLTFYMEGVRCNGIEASPWWERERAWRMKKLGLTPQSAGEIWDKLRPVLMKNLSAEAEELRAALQKY